MLKALRSLELQSSTVAGKGSEKCGMKTPGTSAEKFLIRPHSIEMHITDPVHFTQSDEASHVLGVLDFDGCPWFLEELYGWECALDWNDQGWGNQKGTVGFCDANGHRFVNNFAHSVAPQRRGVSTTRGNFPDFSGMTGLPDVNKVVLFAKVGGGGGHQLKLHRLKLRIYTRSGAAYNTLNMLHLLGQVKAQHHLMPSDGICKGSENEQQQDSTVFAVIKSLASPRNPVPQDVVEVILEFLYLPIHKLPELFHRQARRTTAEVNKENTAFPPDADRKIRSDEEGTFLGEFLPYCAYCVEGKDFRNE